MKGWISKGSQQAPLESPIKIEPIDVSNPK